MPASLTARLALVTAVPLALAAVGLLAHPHTLTAATAHHWAELHVWLLPLFPLLPLGLVVPLRGHHRRDAAGLATSLAWVGAYGYAVLYTGLDAVAGIAGGTVREHAAPGQATLLEPLFTTADALGRAAVLAFAGAVLATGAALLLRGGVRDGLRAAPGTAVLLAACWSFRDSHIFWPRGVFTMLAFAAGFALLQWPRRPARTDGT
ncbi:hypothetical protein ACFYXS_21715 [Streptomyces sp. NPDC002574]|uniref:hypothetical protein n=1 Tax=Streptomyces sp. NPDC002574 TaxID=3364652 RepID=UPI0036BED5F6